MKFYKIILTLVEDVIISERATTVGGHRSLNYIPGSNLLGACAVSIYNDLKTAEQFKIFHSGKVRFGHALPLSASGDRSLPMPFAWHTIKGGPEHVKKHGLDQKTLISTEVYNLIQAPDAIQKQPKQLRQGYITQCLEVMNPKTSLRMKTAIDPDTARAAKTQLFGYQALVARQQFSATLIMDEIDEALEESITNVFSGQIYLGRSRSAQYGKVNCQIIADQAAEVFPSDTTESSIWLISDLALQDQYAQPVSSNTINSALADCGLPDAKVEWERSILRYRRYSHYNSTRRKYDMEKQLIEKGSILTVTTNAALTEQQINHLQAGIGCHREMGMGQVIINHPLLNNKHPQALNEFQEYSEDLKPAKPKPNDKLVHWLISRTNKKTSIHNDHAIAEKYANLLPDLYKKAKRYTGLQNHQTIGPSATQWSAVMELGKQNPADLSRLKNDLFGSGDNEQDKNLNIICRTNDVDWSVTTFDKGKQTTFLTWLQQMLDREEMQRPGEVISIIARKGINTVKQQTGAHHDT